MTIFVRPFALLVLVTMPLFCPLSNQAENPAEGPKTQPVQVTMKNVMYHYTAPSAVHIVKLEGHLLPTKPGSIVVFDDLNSFTVAIASAEVSVNCNSLAQVLNQNVLSSKEAPIRDLAIENKNNQLLAKGKLKEGDVPFEMTGTLSVNSDGRVRLHAEHIKAVKVSVKGLMDLLGMNLSKLIGTKKVPGLDVDKDDLILDPEQLLPPPRIQGKLTAIHLRGSDIVQLFGSPQGANLAAKQPGNFIALRSGEVRFDTVTVRDGKVTLIDMDPGDPFDFYLDHLAEQIAAGYAKTTPQFGLRVYARDYNKLHSRKDPPTRQVNNYRARRMP